MMDRPGVMERRQALKLLAAAAWPAAPACRAVPPPPNSAG